MAPLYTVGIGVDDGDNNEAVGDRVGVILGSWCENAAVVDDGLDCIVDDTVEAIIRWRPPDTASAAADDDVAAADIADADNDG